MMARAGLLRYALPMAAAAAVYHLRAASMLVRAGRLAMYRCRAAHHRPPVVLALCLCWRLMLLLMLMLLLLQVQP